MTYFNFESFFEFPPPPAEKNRIYDARTEKRDTLGQ